MGRIAKKNIKNCKRTNDGLDGVIGSELSLKFSDISRLFWPIHVHTLIITAFLMKLTALCHFGELSF